MRLAQPYTLAALLLVLASPAFAQTTAPGPTTSGDGMSWIWIVILLIIVAAVVAYFMTRNKRSSTSSVGVDRDRIAGSATQAKGSMKEGLGHVTGDAKLQAEGKLDQAVGKAQNTAGGIRDTLKGK